MATRGRPPKGVQGGWFGEPRRHSEAAVKGRQRETRQPMPRDGQRPRPTEIAGIPAPLNIPMDFELEMIGTKSELIEAARNVPADRRALASEWSGNRYALWTGKR